ncbi:putative anti-sigma factor [Pedobacter sp. BAL39]|uniref:FecR family protein n=1 Tax=Pedobacter sp. BAL39 TaxID=391596 RepID=UPI000155AA3A|nr:FecR family protein [Pedobacter sp. BAL39]EDM33928.1 putative anti-sigma factor [Pedobacter sp. BAL39]
MEEKIWNGVLKRLTGTESPESALLLDEWLAADPAHQRQYREMEATWALSERITPEPPAVPFQQFTRQVAETKASDYETARRPAAARNSFWKYGVAASLALMCLLAGLFYDQWNSGKKPQEEWITRKAGLGKVIQISLPDSSQVWLNAGSQITFAKGFNGKKIRAIRLKGEAYFEVKHDHKHPFVVSSGSLKTTVYGTSFSVRAYDNEALTSVSVNSGKVGVSGEDQSHDKHTVMLLPNDKLNYSHRNHQFVKTTINNEDVNAWVKGELLFEQTPLTEVFETLARKYQVKIDTGTQDYKTCKLTARFGNQPIQVVLKAIHLSLNIHSTQIGNTIYLKGGNCM